MSEQHNDEVVQQRVAAWLDEVVVGMGLCPFASQPRDRGAIRISVCHADKPEEILETLYVECTYLLDHPPEKVETTLLVLTKQFADFYDFNDFLGLAEGLIERCGWEGVFQIASFHPGYCFADVAEGDPGNYTNRAPLPILHILREDSVAAAVDSFDDVDEIPERNIGRLRGLTAEELRDRFPWVLAQD